MIGGTPTQEITQYPPFFGAQKCGFRVSAESKRPLARWRSPRSLGARERQHSTARRSWAKWLWKSYLKREKTKHDMDLHSFVWFSNVWYDVWYLRYYQFDHNMISGKPKGCHHAARAMHGSSPHISTVAAASGSRAWPSDKTVVVASGKMLKLMGVFRSRTCDIGTI